MIGLFNDCFPPIMDGVSLTTQNYAYWLHRKAGDVCVVTPKSPDARDAEEYPVYRYSYEKALQTGFSAHQLAFSRAYQPAFIRAGTCPLSLFFGSTGHADCQRTACSDCSYVSLQVPGGF